MADEQKNKREVRYAFIDNMKGVAILLVVLGHVAKGLAESQYVMDPCHVSRIIGKLIYLFHMPLFFSISGFLYMNSHGSSGNRTGVGIVKNLLDFGVVYVISSVAYWLVRFGMSPLLRIKVSVDDLEKILFQPIGPFWYLYALFFIKCIAECLHANEKNSRWYFLAFALLAFFVKPGNAWCGIQYICKYSIYFYFGMEIYKYKDYFKHWPVSAITGAASGVAMVYEASGRMKWVNYLKIIAVLCVIGFFFSIFMQCSKETKETENVHFIAGIGKITMPIYVMHIMIVGGVRSLLLWLSITNVWIHLAAGMLAGTWIPYFLYTKLICKCAVLDFVFYPRKYIMKKQLENKDRKRAPISNPDI